MDGEIWMMERSGENARRITPADETVGFQVVRWSPDQRNLIYLRRRNSRFFEWSIESRSMNGGAPVTVLSSASHSAGLIWMPDERVIYTENEPAPHDNDMNLWTIDVRPDGKPRGGPRKLTNLVGFHMDRLSVSRDGKRMLAVNSSTQWDVYVAHLQKNGELGIARRLTLEDSNDLPLDWTPDSKAVIFVSDRTGIFNIFKQRIDEQVAVQMTTGPNVNIMARVSPDGRWLVYMSRQQGYVPTANLMRVPINGGPPQFIRKCSAVTDIACPRLPATECIAAELAEKQRVLTAFDPITGNARDLFTINTSGGHRDGSASLSPDGSRFALLMRNPQEGVIRFLSFRGEPQGELKLTGWSNLNSADWAPNGKSLFVSSGTPLGATLLRVDLQGRVQPIWQVWGSGRSWESGRTWAIPSPDGRRLALLGQTTHSNAWLLENF